MINRNQSNYHVEYMDVTQHWCEQSEDFAGADALVTALTDGWSAEPKVEFETIYYAGRRPQHVYYVHLVRGDEEVTMPVVHNPYLNRLIKKQKLSLVPKAQSATTA